MGRAILIAAAAAFVGALSGAAIPSGPSAAHAQTLCDDPQESCGRIVPPNCLSRVGAGSLAANDDCAPAAASYRECLALAAQTCGSVTPSPQAESAAAAPVDSALTKRVGRRGDMQLAVLQCSAFDVYLTCDFEFVSLQGDKRRYYVYGNYNNQKFSSVTLTAGSKAFPARDAFIENGDASNYTYFGMKKGEPVRFSVGFQSDAVKGLNAGDTLPELNVGLEFQNFFYSAKFTGVPIVR